MRFTLLLNILTFAGGIGFSWLLLISLSGPLALIALAPLLLAIWALSSLLAFRSTREVTASIGRFCWDLDNFCRGWSITGSTGSGKTASALMALAHQLFLRNKRWGGVIVDPKCVLWEAFQSISKTYKRENDFINLAVRPENAPATWVPTHRYNLLSYPGIPWSTYAKLIVDTAGSLGQASDKGFFRTQAQIHIARGLHALELAGLPVTLRRLYDILTLDDELDRLIGKLFRRTTREALQTLEKSPKKFRALKEQALETKLEVFRESMAMAEEGVETLVSDFNPHIKSDEIGDFLDVYTVVESLEREEDIPQAWNLCVHFIRNYREQPPEQKGGVVSTILNYLSYFTDPAIAEVFCAEENTFKFSDLDQGKFICVSMPQRYQTERSYIFTFLKLLFYTHALNRYDKPKEKRENDNLIVFIADEAQNVVTAAEDGMADYNVVDKIREAKATVIFATQSTTSYLPALKDPQKVKVLLLNLKNQIFFQLADSEAANLAADIISKRRLWKKSYTRSRGQGSTSYTQMDEYWMRPEQLMEMRKFEAIIKHPEQGWQKVFLPPLDEKGRISGRYLKRFVEDNP